MHSTFIFSARYPTFFQELHAETTNEFFEPFFWKQACTAFDEANRNAGPTNVHRSSSFHFFCENMMKKTLSYVQFVLLFLFVDLIDKILSISILKSCIKNMLQVQKITLQRLKKKQKISDFKFIVQKFQ